MACRRMRGAAVLCALAVLTASCARGSAAAPAAPELRDLISPDSYPVGPVDVVRIQRVADVMQQFLGAPRSASRRCYRDIHDGLAPAFPIVPPAGAPRERRSHAYHMELIALHARAPGER